MGASSRSEAAARAVRESVLGSDPAAEQFSN